MGLTLGAVVEVLVCFGDMVSSHIACFDFAFDVYRPC